MFAQFLRAFARDESGVSSSEYALLLLVATTGLLLSTFILGKAISDSVIRTAGLFAPGGAAAAAAAGSGDASAAAAAPAGDSEAPEPVPGCSGKGVDQGKCKGQGKAKGGR
jgi:Flp pilus assembly pilin Flp